MSPEVKIPALQALWSPVDTKQTVKSVVFPARDSNVHRAEEAGRFPFGDFLFHLFIIDSGVMWGSSFLLLQKA